MPRLLTLARATNRFPKSRAAFANSTLGGKPQIK